jgi:capsular exopolysaccharide synthesis family protein
MAQYDVDLRDYWRILKKRKLTVFLMVVLVGLSSYFFAKVKEPIPIYEANAAVKIERRTNLAEFFMSGFWDQSDNIATQVFIIKSFPVLEKTAKLLGWIPADLSAEEIQGSPRHMPFIEELKGMVSSSQEGGTNILEISVTSSEPIQAAAVANAVAGAYREYNIQEKNKQIFETKAFIEEQLRVTEQRLKQAEEDLRALKEGYDLLSPDVQASNTLSRLFELEAEHERVRGEKEQVSAQLMTIQGAGESSSDLQGLSLVGTDNAALQELNKRLRDMVMERKTLLIDYTQEHPEVQELNDKIQGLVFGMKKELTSRLAGLRAQEDDLKNKLRQLKKETQAFPEKALQINRLTREVALQESLYSQLKTKYQEVLIQAAGKIEEVIIIRPATVPAFPINIPSKAAMMGSGLILGVFLGIVFAFVAETLDTSIGTIEDVEKLLSIPVLGVIPFLKKEEKEKGGLRDLITHYDPKSPAAEAFRSIRTNLQFSAGEIRGKSFLITSSFIQEGKTFNVVNIAASLAQTGARVLLVEADLRNPSIHKVFGLKPSPGLSDYVLGHYQPEEIISTVTDVMLGSFEVDEVLRTSGLDNLNYVMSGTQSPNPSEIIRSERFREFMQWTVQTYDMVIVDAPPILPVADAVDIATRVDGVILVYTVGKIARSVLKRAKNSLDHVNARVLGIILNNVRADSGPDYFKYQSRYYYGPREKSSPRRWGISMKPSQKARPGLGLKYILTIALLALILAGAGFFVRDAGKILPVIKQFLP